MLTSKLNILQSPKGNRTRHGQVSCGKSHYLPIFMQHIWWAAFCFSFSFQICRKNKTSQKYALNHKKNTSRNSESVNNCSSLIGKRRWNNNSNSIPIELNSQTMSTIEMRNVWILCFHWMNECELHANQSVAMWCVDTEHNNVRCQRRRIFKKINKMKTDDNVTANNTHIFTHMMEKSVPLLWFFFCSARAVLWLRARCE